MGIYLAEQTRFFLEAIVLGAALGVFYDSLRILRIAIPTAYWIIFIEDVFYFVTCSVITFFFMLRTIDGQVRVFILVGEGLGAVLYYMSLSPFVMSVSKTIIHIVYSVFGFLFRILVLPVWRLGAWILGLFLKPLFLFGKVAKKKLQRCKFHLKVRRAVLYNQLMGGIFPISKKKRKGKAYDDTPESQA